MTSETKYPDLAPQALVLKEQGIEDGFIEKLCGLKYTYRPEIRDRAALEKNFCEKIWKHCFSSSANWNAY